MNRNGRATVNPSAPEPCGICDRCGFLYNLSELVYQKEYQGTGLIEKAIRVCQRTCLDKPAPFLKTILIPPDPIPVRDPRPIPPYEEVVATHNWDDPDINWDDPDINWDT